MKLLWASKVNKRTSNKVTSQINETALLSFSVLSNKSMMQLQKFVEIMIKTKLWPVKVDSDGTYKQDLMHTAVLVPFILALAALCVVLYFTYPGLIFRDWSKMSKIIDFIMVCILVLSVPVIFTTSSSMQTLGSLLFNTGTTLPARFFKKLLVLIVLFAAQMISIEIMVFPEPLCSSTLDHFIYWTSLVFLNLYLILNAVGMTSLEISTLFFFVDALEAAILKIQPSSEDLKCIKDYALKLSLFFDSLMTSGFLFVQISFIFAGYMIVIQEVFPWHALFQFLYNLYGIITMLNLIEECYSLAQDLACKTRENAANCKTISEMTRIQAAVIEMESCFPFKPKGYFTMEKSTLTALAANTLTYLIVLLQFNWG